VAALGISRGEVNEVYDKREARKQLRLRMLDMGTKMAMRYSAGSETRYKATWDVALRCLNSAMGANPKARIDDVKAEIARGLEQLDALMADQNQQG
jgi:hypothetical protein